MSDGHIRKILAPERVSPAVKKIRRLGRQSIRPKRETRRRLGKHSVKIARLVRLDLTSYLGKKISGRGRFGFGGSLEQSEGTRRRNQKADLFALRGDVDAHDLTRVCHCRTAAHTGIERTSEMHFGIERVLQETVVGAFNNRQAEILWMAQRIEPCPLRHRCSFQREKSFAWAVDAKHREVIDHIDR